MNNDGLNDLLIGSPPNRNSSRLFYSSAGTFGLGSVTDFTSSGLGSQVALIGDVGGATLGSPGGGQMDVLLDTLTGLSVSLDRASATTLALPASLTTGVQSAALGDADGDGDLDLALASSGGSLVILLNNGSGITAASPKIAVPTAPANITSLAWGDFNGDHYLDLAVGSAAGTSSLLINNSDLTFMRRTLAGLYVDRVAGCTSGSGRAAAWADVDGDGRLDLTMAFNLSTNSGEVCILRNTGSGFTRMLRLNEDAVGLDWGDWDGDKDLDLAMARSNAGHASIPTSAARSSPFGKERPPYALRLCVGETRMATATLIWPLRAPDRATADTTRTAALRRFICLAAPRPHCFPQAAHT